MEQDSSDICLNVFTPQVETKVHKKPPKKRKYNDESLSVRPEPGFVTNVCKNTQNLSKLSKAPKHKPKVQRKKHGQTGEQSGEASDDGETRREFKSSGGRISSLFGNNPDIPKFARRVVNPVQEPVFSSKQFKDLSIHHFTVSNMESLGLTQLTTVQQKAIPVLLEGSDALIRSQTGSGKTLAYALPIVEALQQVQPKLTRADGIQALVVVPTRELALQTYEWFVKLVKPFTRLVPGCLVGGEKRKSEKARLRKGITVLVGTPGRLVDHVAKTRCLRLDQVRWLVLDEADRLLDMGYERDVASLVSALDSQDPTRRMLPPREGEGEGEDEDEDKDEPEPEGSRRQTVLLSATLTPAVERLAGLALRSPVFVDAADVGQEAAEAPDVVIPDKLVQCYIVTPAKLRLVTLAAFIVWKCKLTEQRKMLLFCATQDMVDYLTELLTGVLSRPDQDNSDSDEEGAGPAVDVEFLRLHGNMGQKERTEVFQTFRAADSGVLLCTDVCARGLDLPHVDLIIQYTAPATVSDYVHRVGRTARVGTAGSALLFLTPSEMEFIRQLEDRRIRLQEEKMDRCLEKLVLADNSFGGRQKPPGSVEAAATALQTRFEMAVLGRRGLHELACKAYVSWVRFYASYPREAREVFSFKALHLGHHAKSFALRDPPSAIGGIGRRQYMQHQRDNRVQKRKTHDGAGRKKLPKGMPGRNRTRELVTSEYASGLEPVKKKKNQML